MRTRIVMSVCRAVCRLARRNGVCSAVPAPGLALPRRVIAFGGLSVFVGTCAMGVWAAVAPLSGAVVAEGMVRDEGERKTIQHQEGGIVRAILVKDGDRVKAGQALVMLDDVRSNAEMTALQAQLDDEKAKAARLTAERDMQSSIAFPQRCSRQQAILRSLAASRRKTPRLFDSERRAFDDQLVLLQQQLAQTRQETKAERALVGTSEQSLGIAKQELHVNEQLRTEGYVTETKMMELRRAAADYQSRQQSD